MRFEILIQFIVPLTFLAIWALTSLLNRDAQPLPPRPGRAPAPGGPRRLNRAAGSDDPRLPARQSAGSGPVRCTASARTSRGPRRAGHCHRRSRGRSTSGLAHWTTPSFTSRTIRPIGTREDPPPPRHGGPAPARSAARRAPGRRGQPAGAHRRTQPAPASEVRRPETHRALTHRSTSRWPFSAASPWRSPRCARPPLLSRLPCAGGPRRARAPHPTPCSTGPRDPQDALLPRRLREAFRPERASMQPPSSLRQPVGSPILTASWPGDRFRRFHGKRHFIGSGR